MFSKWLWYVALKDKKDDTALRKIKKYIIAFGKQVIIKTDNGGEFNNSESKLFYENNNIEHINSSARCTETNGKIESQHKTLQKFIKIALSEKKN